jgi:hypothetical protein
MRGEMDSFVRYNYYIDNMPQNDLEGLEKWQEVKVC